ncbi:uncharacterized protein LOC112086740 [Eutrema salsugineum]|uniref:uncharacterized protein LOC112086740 n=1 Tax=Eutrema salsugineum TaxID=72664 RepID=UPI000CED77AD|nr:uncharacterized protein LOC112086740 [Eutrema salsugineum]
MMLKEVLPHPPVLVSGMEDWFSWRNSATSTPGFFSASRTWTSLQPSGTVVPWVKSVWFSNSIPKHSFIHWVVMRDRLPTRDRLRGWGLNVPPVCLLCQSAPESRAHLFFGCPFSNQVWSSFFYHPSLHPPRCLDDIVGWVTNASPLLKLKVVCKMLLQASIYFVWKERNARLHTAVTKTPAQIIRDVHSILRSRLAGLDRSNTRSDLLAAQPNNTLCSTYLSVWFGFIHFGNSPAP